MANQDDNNNQEMIQIIRNKIMTMDMKKSALSADVQRALQEK